MKQVASPLALKSPKPIRVLPKLVGYSCNYPTRATPFVCRSLPTDRPFSTGPNQGLPLKTLAGIQHRDTTSLSDMAFVERELCRRSVTPPTTQTEIVKKAESLPTRRSCPALFVPERPSNPMSRDCLFSNDDQGQGTNQNEESEQF